MDAEIDLDSALLSIRNRLATLGSGPPLVSCPGSSSGGSSHLSVTPGAPDSPLRICQQRHPDCDFQGNSDGVPVAPNVQRPVRILPLSSASVASQKPWMEGRVCVFKEALLDWEQVVSQL